MIDLFRCRCGSANQEKRSWETCICPRIWALPRGGRVLISKGGVSMRFRRRQQHVPVVRMLWWHTPQKCPSFQQQNDFTDNGLYPLLAPRVYNIFLKRSPI